MGSDLQVFEHEIQDLENKLSTMSNAHAYAVSFARGLTSVNWTDRKIAKELFAMHRHDQNFPQTALDAIDDFVHNQDAIDADPLAHAKLIREVKIECLLATETSPYLEVRANTEATDDPTLPCFTFRAFVIGTIFAGAGSFIDTLFSFRQPPVYVGVSVGQLLACEYIASRKSCWILMPRSLWKVSCSSAPSQRVPHLRSRDVSQSWAF
jgi:hypothetical protein